MKACFELQLPKHVDTATHAQQVLSQNHMRHNASVPMMVLTPAGVSNLPQGGFSWQHCTALCSSQARQCSQAAQKSCHKSIVQSNMPLPAIFVGRQDGSSQIICCTVQCVILIVMLLYMLIMVYMARHNV